MHPRPGRARLIPLLLLVGGCVAGSGASFDEVARETAPGGGIDAVLVEENGGATTSFEYRVIVVPRGEAVLRGSEDAAWLYGAVRNTHAYGANLRWSADTLSVEYESARRDSVLQPTVRVRGRTVTVRLRPGVTDPAAPSGGMLRSQRMRVPDPRSSLSTDPPHGSP